MMTKVDHLPLIARFATPLGDSGSKVLRYDEQRQLSQVLVGDVWRDALTAPTDTIGGTRLTKVAQETTDDD